MFVQLEIESERIRRKFASLVIKTELAIQMSNATVDNLKHFFFECGMNKLATSINPQDSVPTIMKRVSDCRGWSFFDYELLESFIEAFCEDEHVTEILKNYVAYFIEFCKRRLFEIPIEIFDTNMPHVDSKTKVVIKVDREFFGEDSNMKNFLSGEKLEKDMMVLTLNKIKKIQRKLSDLLGIKHLIFLNAQEGCIKLSFRHFEDSNPVILLSTLKKISLALIGVKIISCDMESYDLKFLVSPPPKYTELQKQCKAVQI